MRIKGPLFTSLRFNVVCGRNIIHSMTQEKLFAGAIISFTGTTLLPGTAE